MKYIWLRSAKTGNDIVAPIEHIGCIFPVDEDNLQSMIFIQGTKFVVKHAVHEILDKIDYVRRLTSGVKKLPKFEESAETLFNMESALGVKFYIERNDQGLIFRIAGKDNSARALMSLGDLGKLRKGLLKVGKL